MLGFARIGLIQASWRPCGLHYVERSLVSLAWQCWFCSSPSVSSAVASHLHESEDNNRSGRREDCSSWPRRHLTCGSASVGFRQAMLMGAHCSSGRTTRRSATPVWPQSTIPQPASNPAAQPPGSRTGILTSRLRPICRQLNGLDAPWRSGDVLRPPALQGTRPRHKSN